MSGLIQIGFDYAALPVDSADQLRTWKIEIAAFTDTVESSLVQIGLRFQKAQDELSRQGIKGDGFVAWIESETKYSCSSAYNLINVSTRFKDKPFPNFGKSVLYALSAPLTPEAVIDKAVAKAESGEKVTVADVKDWKALEAELEAEKRRNMEWRDQWKEKRDLAEKALGDLAAVADEKGRLQLHVAALERRIDAFDKEPKPEPEKVEVPPADYESIKDKAAKAEKELKALKKEQANLVLCQSLNDG